MYKIYIVVSTEHTKGIATKCIHFSIVIQNEMAV